MLLLLVLDTVQATPAEDPDIGGERGVPEGGVLPEEDHGSAGLVKVMVVLSWPGSREGAAACVSEPQSSSGRREEARSFFSRQIALASFSFCTENYVRHEYLTDAS